MLSLINQWLDTSKYTTQVERERAVLIYYSLLLLFIGYTLYALLAGAGGGGTLLANALAGNIGLLTYIIAFYAVAGFTYFQLRRGDLSLAGWGPAAMWVAVAVIPQLDGEFDAGSVNIFLALLLLFASLLNYERGLYVSAGVSLLTLIFGSALRVEQDGDSNFFTSILLLFGVGVLIFLFLRYARVTREDAAVRANEERLRLAEITAQISQRILGRAALEDVLTNAVEQIVANYPVIYHAQIFLTDSTNQKAQLVASTGEVGKQLIARRHTLSVGGQSVIGQVTANDKPMVARVGGSDTVHRRNEFLPNTVAEAAFPLRVGNEVIGALDLQSTVTGTFRDDELPLFQSLTDTIAVAIDNARLFDETELRLQENQRLVEQTNGAMQQVQRLNERLTGRAWTEYLAARTELANLDVDLAANKTESGTRWTSTLTEAASENRLVQEVQGQNRIVAFPLRLHGQVIGAMEFELDENDLLSPEDLTLIQEVSERFSLAAENTRLYEESQRSAQREAVLSEISARIQSTNNVENMLSEAARGLKQTLRADRVAIRLGTPNSVQQNGGNA